MQYLTQAKSSCIVDDIITLCQSRDLSGYAYFYFDSRNASDGLANFEALLRSLLSQLSYRCGGIPEALKTLYHNNGDGRTRPSLESLTNTLREIIAGFDHVYIVIDSLDECTDRLELVQWIETLIDWTSNKLHFLFTSRPEPDIRKQLDPVARIVRVMIGGQSEDDILLYLDKQLQTIDWDEESRRLVRSTLGDRAGGMYVDDFFPPFRYKIDFRYRFRWVALQIMTLRDCMNLREIKEQLETLPTDLEETYEHILVRSRRPRDLLQMLHWLAFSTRTLTVAELAAVVSVDLEAEGGPSYAADLRFGNPQIALAVCSGLVTEAEGKWLFIL